MNTMVDQKIGVIAPGLIGSMADDVALMSIMKAIPTVLDFDLTRMRGMGMMDSHKYREKIMAAAAKAGLNFTDLIFVIAAAVSVKNRERIIIGLTPFMTSPRISRTVTFYKNFTEQYVPQCTAANQKVPVVKIPESFPSISAFVFIMMCCEGTPESSDADYSLFMRNLWFAQLNVDIGQKETQMVWERDVFWGATENTGAIQKSKFSSRQGSVKLLFHKDFWDTKAADKYALYNQDGTVFPHTADEYNEAEVRAYIIAAKTFTKVT